MKCLTELKMHLLLLLILILLLLQRIIMRCYILSINLLHKPPHSKQILNSPRPFVRAPCNRMRGPHARWCTTEKVKSEQSQCHIIQKLINEGLYPPSPRPCLSNLN